MADHALACESLDQLEDGMRFQLPEDRALSVLAYVRALEAERDRLKEGIDRLALPIAFGPTGMPDQETVARMTYAHAIAQGRAPKQAEQDARAALNGGGDGE